jgi:hypothetical protein
MSDEGVSESVRILVEPLEAEPLTERLMRQGSTGGYMFGASGRTYCW